MEEAAGECLYQSSVIDLGPGSSQRFINWEVCVSRVGWGVTVHSPYSREGTEFALLEQRSYPLWEIQGMGQGLVSWH